MRDDVQRQKEGRATHPSARGKGTCNMCGENPKLSHEYFCKRCAEEYLIPHLENVTSSRDVFVLRVNAIRSQY